MPRPKIINKPELTKWQVRVEPNLRNTIIERAKKNGRSINKEIIHLILLGLNCNSS